MGGSRGSGNGKSVGTYHFATGGTSGAQEAEYYYEHTKGYVGKGIFVLDWEGSAVNKGPGYAKAFLDRFKELTGIRAYYRYEQQRDPCLRLVCGRGGRLWIVERRLLSRGLRQWDTILTAPLIGGTGPWEMAALYQYTSSGPPVWMEREPGFGCVLRRRCRLG